MSNRENDRASDPPKSLKTPARRPRSPRVPVNFFVEIEGRAAGGASFRVLAEAVKVSRGGGTLKTDVKVNVGSGLRLTPPFGGAIDAEVNGVWFDETDGEQRVGIKLLEANGWFAD